MSDYTFQPFSLTWTGPSFDGTTPTTFMFGPTVTADVIRNHLAHMGILERGAFLALIDAIATAAGDAS